MVRVCWKLSLVVTVVIYTLAHCRLCDSDLTNRTKPDYYFITPQQFCYDNNYVGIASYPEGTALMVQWVAATENNILTLAQINATDPIRQIESNIGTTYAWDGCLPSDVSLSNGNTFNFLLYNSSGWICSSDFFNISASNVCAQRAASSSSSAIAATSSTSRSSVSSPSLPSGLTFTAGFDTTGTAATTPTTHIASEDSGDDHSRLSGSAKIGIGVGVGIGALLAMLGAAFFFLSRGRNKTHTAGLGHAPPYKDQKVQQHSDNAPPPFSQHCQSGPSPVYGQSVYSVQEAPGDLSFKPISMDQFPREIDSSIR
ncbi:hypothetical protein LTS08_008179 [Lithohypha guttulata]|uniref:uncharacterized protein n=1 Tax=Lithohypha guttulata TaxID=1690604 RepID=UPI002DE05920|nr:hypothetical protein LTR51_006185 [Lithohypha guttulata]KAK5095280.1 hypothetical protein LTS08_008179 [Lithohypha guttulata]